MELLAVLIAANTLALKVIAFLAWSFCGYWYIRAMAHQHPGNVGDEIILDHHEEMISK